jgi:hypothetical protein
LTDNLDQKAGKQNKYFLTHLLIILPLIILPVNRPA